MFFVVIASVSQKSAGDHQALRHINDLPALVHGRTTQQVIGLLLAEPLGFHQDALGPIDGFPVCKFRAHFLQLLCQPGKRAKAADRHIKDRFDPLPLEPVDDIGRHPRIDGGLYGMAVRLVDEHRNRSSHRTRHLKHVFQLVAIRVFQIDDNHIRIDVGDLTNQSFHLVNKNDPIVPGIVQSLLDDRGTDLVVIYNQNGKPAAHAAIMRRAIFYATKMLRRNNAVLCRHSEVTLERLKPDLRKAEPKEDFSSGQNPIAFE